MPKKLTKKIQNEYWYIENDDYDYDVYEFLQHYYCWQNLKRREREREREGKGKTKLLQKSILIEKKWIE